MACKVMNEYDARNDRDDYYETDHEYGEEEEE